MTKEAKKEGLILVPGSRVQSVMKGKSRQQELRAALLTASIFGKQRDESAWLIFSFSESGTTAH